jgi:CHASE2 domain-containing sensor protein
MDRELLARFISATADAVARDLFFLRRTDKDQALDVNKTLTLPIVIGAADDRVPISMAERRFQMTLLEQLGRPVGFVNYRREAADGVVRFHPNPNPTPAPGEPAYPWSLALQLAKIENPNAAAPDRRRIAWLRPPASGDDTFATVKAHDPLAGDFARSGTALRQRLVLIGTDFPNDDKPRTPFSRWLGADMQGLFLQAQMLADILAPERAISELTPPQIRYGLATVSGVGLIVGWLLA